jgi:uncharacterized protein YecE (DUF72 family)
MARVKAAVYRIGISGWTYSPWRGVFYPKDLPQNQELQYASRQVNSIEINGSFYSLQRPSSYQKWYDSTPADFLFSLKGGRFITHMRRLKNVEQPLANFLASGVLCLKEKLGPLLWQLPPNFSFDAGRIGAFCELLPRDTRSAAKLAKAHHNLKAGRFAFEIDNNRPMRHAMEVRHESFADPRFIDILRKHNVALVTADTAGKWPFGEDITADFVYIRLHGDEELYASGYSDEALDQWAKRLRLWSTGKQPVDAKRWSDKPPRKAAHRDVYVYFDNDVKVKSPADAMSLAHRLGTEAQGEDVRGIAPGESQKLNKNQLAERVRSHWPTLERQRHKHI